MTTTEILTGSGEFFTSPKDTDFCVFRPQRDIFVYERDDRAKIDRFCYRDTLTKDEFFEWHDHGNVWWLNFAPLITRGFLDHFGIDIFDEDRERVYRLMQKVFVWHYRFPNAAKYGKCLYRVYIYMCFIENGTLTLTEEQHRNAYNIYKRRDYSIPVLRSLYEFFEVPPEEMEIGLEQAFGDQEMAAY